MLDLLMGKMAFGEDGKLMFIQMGPEVMYRWIN